MKARPLIPAALAATLLTPSANAAEVTTERTCYADRSARADTIWWQASGFVPGAALQVSLDGKDVGTAVAADESGGASGSLAAPPLARGELEHRYTLRVRDAATSATTRFAVSKLRARFRPASGDPETLRVRFLINGFRLAATAPPRIYLHYVTPGGRLRRTIRLGTGVEPCGSLRTRYRPLFPFRPIPGEWKLQFDTSWRYTRATPTSRFLFYRVPVRVSG